jgi:hypothetical protein
VNGVGRNDPCPCGSGKKYKKCCQASAVVGFGYTKTDRELALVTLERFMDGPGWEGLAGDAEAAFWGELDPEETSAAEDETIVRPRCAGPARIRSRKKATNRRAHASGAHDLRHPDVGRGSRQGGPRAGSDDRGGRARRHATYGGAVPPRAPGRSSARRASTKASHADLVPAIHRAWIEPMRMPKLESWEDQHPRWIKPHWRGPSSAAIVERQYRLEE